MVREQKKQEGECVCVCVCVCVCMVGVEGGRHTRGENGKEGEIVPDLDLRGSGPSDVSIS